MQAFQVAPRRTIILAICIVTIFIVLLRFYGDVPYEYYRSYGPAEPIGNVELSNDTPQEQYFKFMPEWDFKVPSSAKGYARIPKNKDVIVLTASDGGGHNSAIPNILERVLEDRRSYCERHGFRNLWLNTSRYDIGQAHRTWSKIPAVAEAFYLHPSVEWVWLIDTDIIIMTPETSIVDAIIAPTAIKSGIMRDTPILDGMLQDHETNINTPSYSRVEDMDILVTQDHQSVNTGSIFFRRTAFTRWLLEIMTDYTMLMGNEHVGAEQDALKHLMLEHPMVRNHVGIYPQPKFNAYAEGGREMGYRDGDLVVHFAGCWVRGMCKQWFEEFWAKRDSKEPWMPAEEKGGR
ncbi:glycosyltransferase family 34 protein [Zopfia rhizophila CBS 207.26]|uniref:Glycosyltransferase family 34 protein n=1 Tax=Zopfia rhizophila CBS 207.26 TaxID=1314779 RepID=A0A6A6EN55_9PEZI|nr:glycosyltransferase family 34 protein [Zopfia rhizophila CBS 207.26]